MTKRVAVIGAGAAGLCALRHLSARPKIFHAVCFEKNLSEGGTWIYTEETGTDKNGLPVQSSMYKNLRYYLVTCSIFKILEPNIYHTEIRIFTFLNSS